MALERKGLITSVICTTWRCSPIIAVMSAVIEDRSSVRSSKDTSFLWPILRGIALIVSLCAFSTYLLGLLYWGRFGTAWLVFAIASFLCSNSHDSEASHATGRRR